MSTGESIASELPSCSVAIKCADDPKIVECLDSIDDSSVAINAAITPSERVEEILREREIPYVITEYGNIGKTAQLCVSTAEHDNVIVMDSDSIFAPNTIQLLRQALVDHPVVKPKLRFENDGAYISKVIAASRERYNSIPDKATCPGLAIRRSEVAEACGGLIFKPQVRWTEDADFNYRLRQNNIPVHFVPDAEIWHGPVSLSHELRCGFLYGVGKRLSMDNDATRPSREDFSILLKNIVAASTYRDAAQRVSEYGLGGTLLATAWRTLYYAGYHAQKYSGNWTWNRDTE